MTIDNSSNQDLKGLVIPRHVAIIMDGNGRWAKQRALPRTEGHIKGQESLKATLKAAAEFGIEVLTVYAFSTENWNRPAEEVDALMELLVRAIHAETSELIQEGIRLETIGDLSRLPQGAREALKDCIAQTSGGKRARLVLALSYSSRDEIVRAIRRAVDLSATRGLKSQDITEDSFSTLLDTADLPELDLMIRTGGEERISNFLLWQAAYAELYFSDVYWPDFGRDALLQAIRTYSERERRFGKTSEQIQLGED
ncbi:MAG: polyprenyl diphosphate synthase [Porphyromonadaceae bacterium]|nr:polyprenyl diphosphate synthase [Porphyromonadaceae bacterium]